VFLFVVTQAETKLLGADVAPAVAPAPQSSGHSSQSELLNRIEKLERELQELRAQVAAQDLREKADEQESAPPGRFGQGARPAVDNAGPSLGTLDLIIDGFYSYNFNRPPSGQNALRAYDRTHNSFGLNQASLVFERAPDVTQERRFGVRVDLMYGQATAALQGSPLNELHPETYRPIFQAYGTYVAPLGSGLQVDFGKWASSLGIEGNYTKDQVNYSRSFLFNFLPFYHFGFRANYQLSERWGASYWLVNGNGQAEDFNGFKSNAFFLRWKPVDRAQINWAYYFGNENLTQRQDAGTEVGLPFGNQAEDGLLPLDGKLHIGYTQALWNITDRLLFATELAYMHNREVAGSPPSTAIGGGLLASFTLSDIWSLGARYEKVSDRNGFLSGQRQSLDEVTLTLSQRVAERFLVRYEIRRDASNRPFFEKAASGLHREQTTALLGLTWWVGDREGSW
jgi:hypothetical protein